MDKEQYKQRLIEFNSTPKYKEERDFLLKIMSPQKNEKILDYGTGLGRMVYLINELFGSSCYGYDINDLVNLREEDSAFLFRREFFFKFNKVFFMHSIAHVEKIEDRLIFLRENLLLEGARIFIITPNRDWLNLISKMAGYVTDPTLVAHYNLEELHDILDRCGYTVAMSGQFGALHNGQCERLFIEATI